MSAVCMGRPFWCEKRNQRGARGASDLCTNLMLHRSGAEEQILRLHLTSHTQNRVVGATVLAKTAYALLPEMITTLALAKRPSS